MDINKHDFILYCPLYNDCVTEIDVITEKGAYIGKGKEYENKLPVVYYGSSITQGGCVSRPDNAYQAHIERWTNVYFIDGRKLFGSVDREQCTADKCHPNDLGHYLMAKKIYSVIKILL